MSDYERRLDAAETELDDVGIWRSNGLPPYLRAMRGLGMSPIPPHYMPFWKSALGQGLFFTLLYGLMMYAMVWGPEGWAIGKIALSALTAGIIFGMLMGLYYNYGRRRYKLSRWEDL